MAGGRGGARSVAPTGGDRAATDLTQATPERRGISRRSTIIGLGVGVPASALFLWLAARGIDFGDAWDILRDARLLPVAGAVVAFAVVYLIQAERWRVIAGQPRSTLWHFYGWVISGLAVNNMVPGRPGEFLRAYWAARYTKQPYAPSLSTVVVNRIADVLSLVVFLMAALPFVDHPRWLTSLAVAAIPVGAVLIVAIAGAWWYTSRSARGRRRADLPADARSRLWGQVSGFVRGLAACVRLRDLPAIIGLSLAAWAVWGLAAFLIAEALDVRISLVEAVFITAVINLGVAIPSSPGFVGTYQWLAVESLALFDVGRTQAFALAVLLQAAWYIPVTIVGLGLIARESITRRRPAVQIVGLGPDAET